MLQVLFLLSYLTGVPYQHFRAPKTPAEDHTARWNHLQDDGLRRAAGRRDPSLWLLEHAVLPARVRLCQVRRLHPSRVLHRSVRPKERPSHPHLLRLSSGSHGVQDRVVQPLPKGLQGNFQEVNSFSLFLQGRRISS